MFALSIEHGNIGYNKVYKTYSERTYHREAFVILFERIVLSIRCRVAFMWPSGKQLNEKLHLLAAIVCGMAAIVYGSAIAVGPSVVIVFASAIDWFLTKFGASSHEIQNYISVCPSAFKFGTM